MVKVIGELKFTTQESRVTRYRYDVKVTRLS